MSAPLNLHDVAGSLAAPPFGHGLDEGLRLMSLDLFHRSLVQFHPVREILDGADACVDHCDLAVRCQSVDRADHAVRDRAEALLPTAYEFCGVGHSVPPGFHASMCGAAQRTSQTSGSRLTERNPRYFQFSRLQHSTQRAARSKNFHPHSVSRSPPNQSANSDAGALAPRHPTPASLTLLRRS